MRLFLLVRFFFSLFSAYLSKRSNDIDSRSGFAANRPFDLDPVFVFVFLLVLQPTGLSILTQSSCLFFFGHTFP